MLFAILRIIIGGVLLVSGFEKVLSPYQNFQYVIEAYQFLPSILEKLSAMIVPWVELAIGLFMVLGLWLNWSLKGALVMFACFIVIVGQALLRGLPIDQCGCFGESIHILPQQIIVFDSLVLLTLIMLLIKLDQTKTLSLDRYFK